MGQEKEMKVCKPCSKQVFCEKHHFDRLVRAMKMYDGHRGKVKAVLAITAEKIRALVDSRPELAEFRSGK